MTREAKAAYMRYWRAFNRIRPRGGQPVPSFAPSRPHPYTGSHRLGYSVHCPSCGAKPRHLCISRRETILAHPHLRRQLAAKLLTNRATT